MATTNFDDYPPQAVALPHVATCQRVDVEKIVSLGADLVLATDLVRDVFGVDLGFVRRARGPAIERGPEAVR
jgi:hypothetical protein